MTHNPQQYLPVAVEAAHAGAAVLRAWAGRFTVSEKSRANLVTEADRESQKAIFNIIESAFPDHQFLGEEDSTHNDRSSPPSSSRPLWIVDPLDGTTNYVHGFPYYAVSIALEIDGVLTVGVIYDLTRNEMFTAIKGQGARLNERTIQVSGTSSVGQALLMASIPVAVDPMDPAIVRFVKMLSLAQSVQRSGSAALNLAYVACGRLDGFWSSSLKPWDMAAGALIVEEAGGILTDLNNSKFSPHQPTVMCSSSPKLQQEVLAVISPSLSEQESHQSS